jgi:RND family efflux transporter MFP subunit
MFLWLKKYKWLAVVVVVSVLAFFYFRSQNANKEYQEYIVEERTMRDTLELSGRVTAEQLATLRFPTGGLLTYLGPKEGDTVQKWQTLASVDSRQLQKTLEQKLNLYAKQRGTFEQTIDDNDNAVPGGDLGRELKRLLEANQYSLENTVKDVEYLDLSLKLTRLTSPIAGVLVSSPTSVSGVHVGVTDAWVVVDPNSLYFSADLDETDLTRVKSGQKVEITLDAYEDKTYTSTISKIAFTPKETTAGTVYEIKATLPESELSSLRLGLNGVSAIILEEKEGVSSLPSSALTFEGDKVYVLVLDNSEYVRREVTTGIENEGYVEIISGISRGDRVYTEKTD